MNHLLEYINCSQKSTGLKEYRLALIEEAAKGSDVKHTFIRGDLADKELVDRVFDEYKPSIVVNLAAQAGVRYSIDHPDAYINSNIIGFYNILEACRHSYDDGQCQRRVNITTSGRINLTNIGQNNKTTRSSLFLPSDS